ncbi:MAG TPA: glycosyl transferase [Bacteroidales bacterium]|nr:MAG: glycosyl transferase [Bacteroidetes bacterium GWF2_33_38]OFY73713.1 MAG: glycosyl transferase [Bacteroidetes bacterium RIFOXYA12_FULL_33_9]OFY89241.1 MAG: glycosyl transferase [Bacteroidetes bacterium RIFOXYA2_FULL_33_7]HBF87356.1 glycosyl transferase [Bacteroidales bacterium]
MKICHITTVHDAKDVRIFYKECSSLSKLGHDVYFVVLNGKSEVRNNVTIIGVESKYNSRIKRMLFGTNMAYKEALKLNADVYHFHDPEFLFHGIKLHRKGKKVIYDAHEDYPRQILGKYYLSAFTKKVLAFLVEKLENYGARRFEGIITATPYIKERYIKLNNNTVDINNFPILEQLPEPSDWNQKSNEICYIGALSRVRGIYEIVKSLETSNCRLNLGGSFDESEKLHFDVKSLQSWGKVNELGFINRNQVNEILKKSKIGMVTLHPIVNYLDSLPVKMFEYMAAGLPVIASDFPLWKSIIEEKNCGICVNPLNPIEISEAINKILSDNNLAKEMGINGRKLVLEQYNWAKEEVKLKIFYSNILASKIAVNK